MQPKIKSAFQLLGLSPHASLEEVKQSYRKLAKKYHPDVAGDSANHSYFAEIANAYQLLVDYFEHPQQHIVQSSNERPAHHQRTSRSKENMEERMRKAKERAKMQENAEREAIMSAYAKINKPSLKYTHLFISLFSLIVIGFASLDFFLPETKRSVEIQNVSNLYQSARFDKVTAVVTYGNELFYVDGDLLFQLLLDKTEASSRNGFVHESQLLHIPRKLSLNIRNEQYATFEIDEPAFWMFPFYTILLFSGILFYLIKPKKMFSNIVFFYATFGLSIIGLILVCFNSVLGRIINFIVSTIY